jgi:hypothetical protein
MSELFMISLFNLADCEADFEPSVFSMKLFKNM